MEISAIKQRLSLSEVLKHYSLEPKNSMLKCCWHNDNTASLQVNLEKNFYKCHACGKTGDVIQFIEDYEKISKHEAIKKAEGLMNNEQLSVKNIRGTADNLGQTDFSGERSALFLENTFSYFRKALYCSNPAKQYIEKRNLDNSILEIGYNSGQFHHGERKSEELINNALEVGLLQDKGLINNRTGEKGYSIFANKCIAFPLKNKENEIVSFYFRAIVENKNGKHFYLKNRSGIYPGYPKSDTKKLILTEAIIDCASLLQIKEIRENYSLISCFGTNGLNEEILKAIEDLPELEEIIFCFDHDKAGKEAIEKYAKMFNDHLVMSQGFFSFVELPNKDVNETLQLHDEEIFTKLLEERKFIFSDEENGSGVADHLQPKSVENTGISTKENLLSGNRTQTNDLQNPIDFLQQKELLQNLNRLIEKAGIIGEENSRLLLFLITISYLNKSPLHGIVQGSSGSGKTHIISRIADMMPQEDVLRFTRITESSLYNWGEFDLFQKIIIIEDLDGLKEDALYALREFISNQVLRSSVTIKDKKGNNKSSHKIVKGQFSSLSATTKGELYEDNMNRSFIVAINESEEQTEKIISYQNRRNAGEIDRSVQEKAIGFIQKIVRNLKHYEVINPYATQIQLPNNVKNKRRLNEMFQSIIKQITIIHQYQRRVASDNYLITEIEDIENAVEILFESIILKIDELDGSLRQFFEKLKKAFKEESFTRFDAMEVTGFKKTQLQFYLNDLVRLEYLKQIGFANKGFKYKISYSDNIQKVRKDLKEAFTKQLEELKVNATEHKRTPNGSETNTRILTKSDE
ncbi:CHC2 zinc finger domain-containing protein [Chryseobacterium sp. Ch-15]|uniref:CHC2 zinc finger domain-containing protein n=1 Tax=Chryseobacterium muglaense TaxID=2893752 RepID=A0A9Q3UYV3_9FLAO|nr:CHC2 zinc finger domain-containing protein [Chryseobacterium muglaense]MBD3907086.1 toprim domain-containing protein [Chryseobacterium muglaense]MBD3907093.1 toprim domain-containing protein [Chryseobacterium muglaense]MCC9036536.1 CHC2 zinc finger domain-containing protein [Chryseobacterium muglaense]MCC9036543.1 CHC2 zinc finger domain-containing protein [Chryseobacterium muglaense]MCM2556777.1 CHC2 zinc finger domain-containing protein [Chryseobacterium muglaense]